MNPSKIDAKCVRPAIVTIDGEEFPGNLRELNRGDVLIFRPEHPIHDKLTCTDNEQNDDSPQEDL